MPLLREQYDYTLRFDYYKDEPHEALLFTLTQTQIKVEFAKEVMAFDLAAAKNPERIAQLQHLKADNAMLVRCYPDLMRPQPAGRRIARGLVKQLLVIIKIAIVVRIHCILITSLLLRRFGVLGAVIIALAMSGRAPYARRRCVRCTARESRCSTDSHIHHALQAGSCSRALRKALE